jgi:cyclophilin family peptidyl-prolyl cis-trans isomerase
MKRLLALSMLALAAPLLAQEAPVTPGAIVAAAPAEDWVAIAAEDLLVMELAPDAEGNKRTVTIQLMPPPFSQGWVGNIRTLAKAHWWDGTNIYRVQDNYVTQWGGGAIEKAEPEGLTVVPESEYVSTGNRPLPIFVNASRMPGDVYADRSAFVGGWPVATDESVVWPTHCYGMVGVARGIDNTGSGSDLYVVIGHAPRQLDRNIAVVGRVIEGIEHLSALPRGKGDLGFYDDNEAAKRVPILSVRLGTEASDAQRFEYLSTESESFARYVHVRANRQDDFYKVAAGGVDICNAPVPVRRIVAE